MQISEIKLNDGRTLLFDDKHGGLWLQPVTGAQAKRLRALGRQAQRKHAIAAAAEKEADAAISDDELEGRAAEKRAESDACDREMAEMLFGELVVDAAGELLTGNPEDAPIEVVSALWDRIHEVFDDMGKPQRTAKSGSARKASTRTTSR